MTSGYRHSSGLWGTKVHTVGLGTASDNTSYMYDSLSDAVDAAAPGDLIILSPGTHTLTETLTINKSITIIGEGDCSVTGEVADRLLMMNVPSAGAVETYIRVENVKFTNNSSGADVLEIDNDAGNTADIYIDLFDVSLNSTAGVSVDLDQTTNTIDIYFYCKGRMSPKYILDDCNLALTKAGSKAIFDTWNLSAGQAFALGTANVASIYEWYNCIFGSNAITTGGAASVIENCFNSTNASAGAFASLVANDFDATAASENICAAPKLQNSHSGSLLRTTFQRGRVY